MIWTIVRQREQCIGVHSWRRAMSMILIVANCWRLILQELTGADYRALASNSAAIHRARGRSM
jgi:hypothetical protein